MAETLHLISILCTQNAVSHGPSMHSLELVFSDNEYFVKRSLVSEEGYWCATITGFRIFQNHSLSKVLIRFFASVLNTALLYPPTSREFSSLTEGQWNWRRKMIKSFCRGRQAIQKGFVLIGGGGREQELEGQRRSLNMRNIRRSRTNKLVRQIEETSDAAAHGHTKSVRISIEGHSYKPKPWKSK